MAAENKNKGPVSKEVSHWVCLHNFPRFESGKVVARIQWPEGTDFAALQRLGAIRPAEAEEVQEGAVDINETGKEAQEAEVTVLKTQIDLLEKELAFHKDEAQKVKLAMPNAGPGTEPSEGVKTLIKKKDAAIGELTEKLNAKEAERLKLAEENEQLKKSLEEATKPQSEKK